MNLYKFHAEPHKLEHHETAQDRIVELFWDTYKNNPEELKKREKAIARSSYYSYVYAMYVLQGPFNLGEPAIAKNTKYSYWYAKCVLNGPFKLGEPAIAREADDSYYYARNVLNGPFKLGEPAIAKSSRYKQKYEKLVGHEI
jgi:hypothetical protein